MTSFAVCSWNSSTLRIMAAGSSAIVPDSSSPVTAFSSSASALTGSCTRSSSTWDVTKRPRSESGIAIAATTISSGQSHTRKRRAVASGRWRAIDPSTSANVA